MNAATFLEMEFLTIRKEIEETHGRIFQVLVGGSTVVPVVQLIVSNNRGSNLGFVALALPFVVIVLVLIYLAQNLALMRCGRYIKDYIEPRVPTVLGWETWMERNPKRWRLHDTYVRLSFYALSVVYYAVSTGIALDEAPRLIRRARDTIELPMTGAIGRGQLLQVGLAAVYLVLGVLTLSILLRHARASHRTTKPQTSRAWLARPSRYLWEATWVRWNRARQPTVYRQLAERLQQHIIRFQRAQEADRSAGGLLATNNAAQRAFTGFCASFCDVRITIKDLLVEEDRLVARIELAGVHGRDWLGLPATHLAVRHVEGLWIAPANGAVQRVSAGEIDPQDVMHQLCAARRWSWFRRAATMELSRDGGLEQAPYSSASSLAE